MVTNRLTLELNSATLRVLAFTVSFGLLSECGSHSWGNEIRVVVPSEFDGVEGNSGGPDIPGIGYRVLTIFSASEFESLPESHRSITAIALRPNASVVEPRATDWGEAQWFLSTTQRPHDQLSNVFAENHGADKTVVFHGPLTLTTQAAGPPEGPREFDYRFSLQEPFFYDPGQGNLALEFILPDGITPAPLDDQGVRPNAALSDFPLSDNTTGAFRGDQLIVELTFVPEPSTFVGLTVGLLGILIWAILCNQSPLGRHA